MHHASEPRLFKGDEATGRHYIQILLLLQRVSARGALVVLSWWPGVCVSRGGGRAFSGAGFDLDSRGGREDTGTRRHYAKEMVRAR